MGRGPRTAWTASSSSGLAEGILFELALVEHGEGEGRLARPRRLQLLEVRHRQLHHAVRPLLRVHLHQHRRRRRSRPAHARRRPRKGAAPHRPPQRRPSARLEAAGRRRLARAGAGAGARRGRRLVPHGGGMRPALGVPHPVEAALRRELEDDVDALIDHAALREAQVHQLRLVVHAEQRALAQRREEGGVALIPQRELAAVGGAEHRVVHRAAVPRHHAAAAEVRDHAPGWPHAVPQLAARRVGEALVQLCRWAVQHAVAAARVVVVEDGAVDGHELVAGRLLGRVQRARRAARAREAERVPGAVGRREPRAVKALGGQIVEQHVARQHRRRMLALARQRRLGWVEPGEGAGGHAG